MRHFRIVAVLLVLLLTGALVPLASLDGFQPAADQPSAPELPPGDDAPFEPESGQDGKDVVWVPTPDAVVEKMLDLAEVTASDYVIDLGSGDGRTVIAAAQRGARALGVEFNPKMVALSRRRAAEAGVTGRTTFVEGDLFETDLSQATVITMFLLPSINMQLRPRLLELAPGTRIASNSFTMEDWEPDARETVPSETGCESWCTALLWIVPANVEGTWQLGGEDLQLEQQFQMLTGTLGSRPIAEGKVRGTEISFTVGEQYYTGRINGTTLEGTLTGAPGRTWKAVRAAVVAAAP